MYKRIRNSSSIVRVADGATIPADMANIDYVKFLADFDTDPDCVADADPPSVAEINAPIIAQILALESGQGRALREAALNLPGAVDRLQALDDEIAGLRATLAN